METLYRNLPGGTKNTTKNVNQDGRYPGGDTILHPYGTCLIFKCFLSTGAYSDSRQEQLVWRPSPALPAQTLKPPRLRVFAIENSTPAKTFQFDVPPCLHIVTRQPASQPASQSVSQPASQPASQPSLTEVTFCIAQVQYSLSLTYFLCRKQHYPHRSSQ